MKNWKDLHIIPNFSEKVKDRETKEVVLRAYDFSFNSSVTPNSVA